MDQIGIREGEEHGRKPHFHIVSMEPQIGIREGTRQIALKTGGQKVFQWSPRLVSGRGKALALRPETT